VIRPGRHDRGLGGIDEPVPDCLPAGVLGEERNFVGRDEAQRRRRREAAPVLFRAEVRRRAVEDHVLMRQDQPRSLREDIGDLVLAPELVRPVEDLGWLGGRPAGADPLHGRRQRVDVRLRRSVQARRQEDAEPEIRMSCKRCDEIERVHVRPAHLLRAAAQVDRHSERLDLRLEAGKRPPDGGRGELLRVVGRAGIDGVHDGSREHMHEPGHEQDILEPSLRRDLLLRRCGPRG
jgi:hypothetical protein